MSILADYRPLLAAGGEIITATAPQAQAVRAALGRAYRAEGHRVWDTPKITHYTAWLESSYRQEQDRLIVLDPYAQLRLWQWVIEHSTAGQALVAIPSTAREASRTWGLLHEWQIPLESLTAETTEQEAFLSWAQAFVQRCQQMGVTDSARLVGEVTRSIGRQQTAARTPIVFYGFTHETPARRALIDALKRAGHPIDVAPNTTIQSVPVRHRATSPDAETEAMVDWLIEGLQHDPNGRYAVIVPDLAERLPRLERLLTDRLVRAHLSREQFPVGCATHRMLADAAVVDTALALLGLGAPQTDVLRLGQLLRSPYLAGDESAAVLRAEMDACVRHLGQPSVHTDDLATCWQTAHDVDHAFVNAVQSVRRTLSVPGTAATAEWAERFQRVLRTVGWPGPRQLSALEYQSARALTEALARFGRLSTVLGPLSLYAALSEFRALVMASAAPSIASDPSIWLLDRLEDPALPLTGLWVAGLAADTFPAAAAPAPFIALGWQRRLQMPGVIPAQMLADAKRAMAGWLAGVSQVVLSVATHHGDAEIVPSRLLPDSLVELSWQHTPSRAEQLFNQRTSECYAPGVLSVWPESTKLPGGTAVVQLQAECGFKASAAWRFKARALESPQPGLARRIRGDMAHEALRLFWTQVPDQATLLAMSAEQCERHVSRVVDAARRAQKPALPNSRLVALECAWLSRVLMRWLDKERTRSAFSIVECEQSHEVVVAGCTLTVRIDRVDRLEDGSTVILDYKTGQRDARQWVGTRPNPAQLPFYAAHRQPPPDAVALALVAHANKSFSGLAARNDLLPGIVGLAELRRNSAFAGQAWSTVISEWRAATIGLVRAFVSGESLVDPARAACDRCDLAGLCRIPFKHDLNSVDVSDEDSSEEQMETAS